MIRRKSQKMVILILAGVLIVSISWSSVGFDSIKSMENGNISDVHAQELLFLQGKTESRSFQVTLKSHIQDQVLLNRDDYELGELIWIYNIPPATFNGAQAIIALPDINEDGIDEVVVCSEDDNIYCLDGASLGSATVLWTHEIYAGDVYNQNDIDLIEDVDDDGYQDIVVGATGGARLIRCISGESGTQIWEHDTHEYGGGGWVYQVNCSYDYDGDGVTDVLATTGDDSGNTGPKRVYCLDGETGVSIWERPLNGPGFSVIGVEDFTGDGQADVLAGSSNEGENEGYAKGINGATGIQVWSFTVAGSSVWALAQINDITNDGIKDVIIGDFSGHIYGLDATD